MDTATPSEGPPAPPVTAEVVVHTTTDSIRWLGAAASLTFDASPGSPWLLVPPVVRMAFNTLREAGVPLAETEFGPPMLGVKTGCNVAFLVSPDESAPTGDASQEALVAVRTAGSPLGDVPRRGRVERALLRPVVRGQTLVPRRPGEPLEHIIWTHNTASDVAEPLPRLPPYARRWLGHYYHRLAARSDTRGRMPWWSLFRTESAASSLPRVVWSDFGRTPRAMVLLAADPTVPLNTCYVARAPAVADAHALATLLNSEPVAAWLSVLAEPARGGFRRYLGWTVALLPLPRAWQVARATLASFGACAATGKPCPTSDVTRAVASAYDVSLDALQPMIAWASR